MMRRQGTGGWVRASVVGCLGAIGLCAVSGLGQAAGTTGPAGAYGIAVGRETTYLTAPLLPDGRIDYAEAINAEASKGVTPENNAACLIARIVRSGGSPWQRAPEDVLARMGVDLGAQRATWTSSSEKLDELMEQRKAGQRPWKRAEMPEVAAWLEGNRAAMELFAEASRKSRWWVPARPSGEIMLDMPSWVGVTRSVAGAMWVRSMMRLGEGDERGAWEDLAACERMAGLVEQSPDELVRLMATGIHRGAMATMGGMIEHGELGGDVLGQIETTLNEQPRWPADGQRFLQSERYQFLMRVAYVARNLQEAMGRDGNALREQFRAAGFTAPDWNRVMRMGNGVYDLLQKDPMHMAAGEREAYRRSVAARIDEMLALRGGDDPARMRPDGTMDTSWLLPRVGETQDRYTDRVGAAIFMMVPPDPARREGVFEACNEAVAWTRVAVALVRYGRDQGGYPAELGMLVPKYVAGLPERDAELPVRYERMAKGFVLTNASAAATTRPGVRAITIRREK